MRGLHRALSLLELIAEHQPIGAADLSRRASLPKSTVQRTVLALAEAGWIRQVRGDQTRWALTSRMLVLARRAPLSGDLREAARDPMQRLRDRTDETVTLQVPDGRHRMVLIERLDSHQPVRTFERLGATSPMPVTSGGLACLACLPDPEVDLILATPVPRLTPRTVTDPGLLRRAVEQTRRDGYAVNVGQNRPGVCAVGAAVLDAQGAPVAGLGISLPESRFTPEKTAWWGGLARATAAEVAAALDA